MHKVERLLFAPVNRILHGDCADLMKELPDECLDLTVTSPPYDSMRIYGGHEFEPERVIEQLWRITKPGGIVVWVVQDAVVKRSLSMSSYQHALVFQLEGWTWHDEITLTRTGRRYPATHRRYGPCEKAFVFSKGRPNTINMLRDRPNKLAGTPMHGNIRKGDKLVPVRSSHVIQLIQPYGFRLGWWQYSAGGRPKDVTGDHPARMPEKMAEDLIVSYSNPGDVVFDPMCRSGTTCKMALLNRRLYVGVEIHQPYVEIARERLRLARQQRLGVA